jgi:hypothetical protein
MIVLLIWFSDEYVANPELLTISLKSALHCRRIYVIEPATMPATDHTEKYTILRWN